MEFLSDGVGHLLKVREGAVGRVRCYVGIKATTAELPGSAEAPAEAETRISVAPSTIITACVTPGCRHGQGGQLSTLPVRCTQRTME